MQFGPRLSPSRTTALVVVGDVVCIGLFSTLGVLQHNSGQVLTRVPEVAAPFLVGWALVGLLAGAFVTEALATPREAAARAAVAWLGADVVGQALRATSLFSGSFDPAFFLVSLFVTGTLLVCWRAVASRALA
ncbi:DUF3054 domain-containing protein [Halorarius litoreus]|uniref:DUF3054 domain-containing protein n=1 Tax=Halorarius litoreus TaxID=2962676 RepID=UPI0020CC6163|nr:DUF3054 domain-containing protein [Halorarius litoreus]